MILKPAFGGEGTLLFSTISGSHAYGTNIPTSDIDERGVYLCTKEHWEQSDPRLIGAVPYNEQVNDDKNDKVFYELDRFFLLLEKSNPNMVELLFTPDDCIVYKHPIFDKILEIRNEFITQTLINQLTHYASAQIKKATGLNKKINKPVEVKKKDLIDFCFVPIKQGAMPMKEFIKANNWKQEQIGLVKIPNMNDMYHVFYDTVGNLKFHGMVRDEQTTLLRTSSVPKDLIPRTIMSYNAASYQLYCKEYKEYWDWRKNRNEARYEEVEKHGQSYDGKNMMHCLRLLQTGNKVLKGERFRVRVENREQLLSVRKGEYKYEELLQQANTLLAENIELLKTTSLPKNVDKEKVRKLSQELRIELYK